MKQLTLHIAADHPTAAGHFPGNPILPGAWLLAEVLHSIGQAEQLCFTACQVRQAKFLAPVRPGAMLSIEYTGSAAAHFEFRCSIADIQVLSGVFVVSA